MFRTQPGSDWIAEVRQKPVPKKLLGDLWLEGELAIMFGDGGTDKSILAVQIAESIARGRPVFAEVLNVGVADGASQAETRPSGSVQISKPKAAVQNPALVDAAIPDKQRVLYFDFDLGSRQFDLRYAGDPVETTNF